MRSRAWYWCVGVRRYKYTIAKVDIPHIDASFVGKHHYLVKVTLHIYRKKYWFNDAVYGR